MVVAATADVTIASASSCKEIMMMPVAGGGTAYPSKFMELRWIRGRRKLNPNPNPNPNSREFGSLKSESPPLMMPIYISTDPSHINIQELGQLYGSCNHSCQRFPEVDPNTGLVKEAMDMGKLRIALSNSCVIVSVFCKPQHIQNQEKGFVEDFMESVMPVTPSNGHLVGFGRAVSDLGLTASVYDVMVIPSLQGMGIGTLIVKRIVRILTSRDIYDIAALCSRKERFFFKACGFRDDILGSTTMMYTRTVSTCFEGDQIVKRAGRKLLLAPPLREPFANSKTSKPQS